MAGDLITISSSVLPETVRVLGFRGTEALSTPYHFEIFLVLAQEPGEQVDLADTIGAKACLTVDRADDRIPPFYFSGILPTAEILHASDGRVLLRVSLVPRLWQLSLSRHSRIFTKMSVPDVIQAVLDENGISDVEMRLGSYETEEHICQYRESDLDFLSRWMEREGIFYFFEHEPTGEKLILCDAMTYEADVIGAPVRYFPQIGEDLTAGASFRSFTCRHTTLPATVQLKDYDYVKPNLKIAGSADVAQNGAGEVSLYGERFFTPAAGERLAKLRAEELRARQAIFHASGTRLHLRPGHTFELEDHPMASFNAEYLAVEVRHYGNQGAAHPHFRQLMGLDRDDVYFVELDAISANTQFRAPTRAPWPRIYGYENGTVDGSADSEYAQIDEHGRYNVKFKFDESALKSGKASTFVRMMQPHGGGIEGFHFPLRKSTEVVLSFLGGDPDRPVISGVVPNALTPSPVTRGNHTTNVIQTGGRNRLELEDKSGQQRITMSTPYSNTYVRMGAPNFDHELIVHTDDNALLDAHKNWDVRVGQKLSEIVESDVYEEYKASKTEKVQNGPVHEYYKAQDTHVETQLEQYCQTLKVYVGGETDETHQGAHRRYSWSTLNEDIGGNYTLVHHNPVSRTIHGTLSDTRNGAVTERTQGDITRTVTGNITETVTGNWTQNITGSFAQTVTAPTRWDWFASHFNNKLSPTVVVNFAISSTTTIGATFDNFVGIKLGITASLGASFAMGVNLEMNAAVKLGIEPTRLKQGTMELVFKALELSDSAAALYNKGIMVIS